MNCLSFIKTDEMGTQTSTGSGNNGWRPNYVYPGRIGGASNRVGGGFGDDDLLSNRNGSHSGLGSLTVSDDAQRAIPGIFMSMDGEERPARE